MRLRFNILTSTLILSVLSLVMIYSASSYSAELQFGDGFFYVKKQALGLIVGLLTLIAGARIKIELLKKLRWVIYGVAMVLLAVIFIPGVGQTSYGATRWINLGFITFQPSEIAKFALVILLAGECDVRPPNKIKNLIIPIVSGISMCVLIMLEPNMSITMCVAMVLIVMLFVGGMKKGHLGFMGAVGASVVPILILSEPYRMRRLLAFLNPWASPKGEGYQLIQSYYALGSGGLFGVGLFKSRQKYLFLPFAESDFIFSVIGEELGLIGSLAVLTVYFVLILSGIVVAMRAEDKFKSLLAAGVTAVIAIQTLLNIAVVSGIVPPTGLPLPYVSAGGSSLMVFMFVSGLLINLAPKDKPFNIHFMPIKKHTI